MEKATTQFNSLDFVDVNIFSLCTLRCYDELRDTEINIERGAKKWDINAVYSP